MVKKRLQAHPSLRSFILQSSLSCIRRMHSFVILPSRHRILRLLACRPSALASRDVCLFVQLGRNCRVSRWCLERVVRCCHVKDVRRACARSKNAQWFWGCKWMEVRTALEASVLQVVWWSAESPMVDSILRTAFWIGNRSVRDLQA